MSTWRCASTKTRPERQDIFARIPAREAFEPGVIDPATLHIMSILDRGTASSIEKLCNFSFRNVESGDCFVLEASIMNSNERDDAPDFFDFGVFHQDFARAEQLGILGKFNNICFSRDDDGRVFEIGHRKFKLKLPKTYDDTEILGLPFTPPGAAFRSLIAIKADDAYAAAVVAMMKKVGLKLTEISV